MCKIIPPLVITMLFCTVLNGCTTVVPTSQPEQSTLSLDTQERVLKAANNRSGLMEFYKNQLKAYESETYRLKLAEVYLSEFDPESALFTLDPLLSESSLLPESAVVAAKAHMELGQWLDAQSMLEYAHDRRPTDGEIANLLGVVYAEQMKLPLARKMFNLARNNFYNDLKVKNNLALLDILEGNYPQALNRLLLLANDSDVDQQTRANLILAMAKNDQQQAVFDALDPSLTVKQKQHIYGALKSASFAMNKGVGTAVSELESNLSEPTVKPFSSETAYPTVQHQ